ncbi:unnamed protein product [Nyctereutes procyonoides]|uniref:(raccoon dog) hypothetical protein n=1 Tax=Nyctereutes procyonoides TaxID=34880 RepID=A0A811Y5C3_NYCPR|nr:unnamed protein product [Nyctereutes procyonoides]
MWASKPLEAYKHRLSHLPHQPNLSSDFTVYDYARENKVPSGTLQKFFQKSDGVPIHPKRGLSDQMLYRTTMALTLWGWGWGTICCLIALSVASQRRNK